MVPVLRVGNHRIFVAESDAVHRRDIALLGELVAEGAQPLGELAKVHARLQQRLVLLDVRVRLGIEAPLLVARPRVAHPGARDVAAVAVGADQVGVEGHDVAALDDAHRRFAEPRVGARPRRQQATLDPFAPARDVPAVQLGPERVLGDTGPERLVHRRDGLLADGDAVAHQGDLAGRLDQPRVLHHLEPVGDLVAQPLQLDDALRRDTVDGDAPIGAAVLADHRVQIDRPRPCLIHLPRTGQEVEEGNGGAHLVDGGEPGDQQVAAAAEFEEADQAFGRHIDVARLVVGAPDLHVRRVDGVADIQRVVEEDAGEIAFREGLAHTPEPIEAHRVDVAGRGAVLHRAVLARRVVDVGTASHGPSPQNSRPSSRSSRGNVLMSSIPLSVTRTCCSSFTPSPPAS